MKKHKIVVINELKKTRQKHNQFLLNFLANFSRYAILMHQCLDKFRKDHKLIQEAKRNYLISLATALETFYRDLFIHCLEKDQIILHAVTDKIREKYTLTETLEFSKEKISISEISATHFSFQNIHEIDAAMTLILSDNYIKVLDKYEHECVIPSKCVGLVNIGMMEQWQKSLGDIFEHRHALVHDANLECSVSPVQMAQLETVALQVAQFTTAIVLRKIDQYGIMDGVPVFFIISDLIADDWAVVEEYEQDHILSR
jgi:hypothetical protein